eukprot:TRINITY_DN1496_c3_g1_i1.p1 TRINITY_DN1496_c3_g1~~TRINITY_DN1496_c3_g1_i1.p1  ORF type:complete len:388 (-),score=141.69 TRINITY_DN1496_c3_g1_i1:216-1379(-)
MKCIAIFAATSLALVDGRVHGTKQSPVGVDLSSVTLPSVPVAKNADKDGFPTLPTVEAMLGSAKKTLSEITKEQQVLSHKLKTVQQQNVDRMDREKTVFDRKLHEQEQKSKDVVNDNKEIAKRIMAMKKGNDDIREKAISTQQKNDATRAELAQLSKQLGNIRNYVRQARKNSDDSKAVELNVLRENEKKEEVAEEKKEDPNPVALLDLSSDKKADISDQITDDGSPEVMDLSFMSISEVIGTSPLAPLDAEVQAAAAAEAEVQATEHIEDEPEGIVKVLSTAVSKLQAQGKDSEAKLKALFLENFKAGGVRHKALLAQKEVLGSTLKEMKGYESKLLDAKKKVAITEESINKRVKATGEVLQKLAQIALQPPEKSQTMLATMMTAA